ncbi:hypothetical protein [Nocardioides pantholopis]|uniref:hypothetical protein n=1 Tax=Nocardioides pantholopis TaxID=2483798 RepID=UPI000F094E12|nr:hypothetical protein [Nocardioides pantholopis]
MSTQAAPAPPAVVRHEAFGVGPVPPRTFVHVGADPVSVEFVEGLTEVQVDVAPGAVFEAGAPYERLLRLVRGAAIGGGTESPEGLRAYLLSTTEVTFSSFDNRLVVRSPQRGAVRFGTVALTVRAPAGGELVVRGDVVRLQVTGTAGAIRVKARRGDVSAASAHSVDLRLGQGRASLGTVHGAVVADLHGASLDVADLAGAAEVVSSRGTVALTLRSGGAVELALATDGAVDVSDLPPVLRTPSPEDGTQSPDRPAARRICVVSSTGDVRVSRRGTPEPAPGEPDLP